MGVKESAAIRARQRAVAARVEQLIARADERAPIGSGRRAAMKAAVSEGRAALRKRDRALAEMEAATADVGSALNRIVEAGLKHYEAFEALGLSIGVGRRLMYEAQHAPDRRIAASSTTSPAELVGPVSAPKPERNATSGGTTKGTD